MSQHPVIHFPTNLGVSEEAKEQISAAEGANKVSNMSWANKRRDERVAQYFQFLVILNHSFLFSLNLSFHHLPISTVSIPAILSFTILFLHHSFSVASTSLEWPQQRRRHKFDRWWRGRRAARSVPSLQRWHRRGDGHHRVVVVVRVFVIYVIVVVVPGDAKAESSGGEKAARSGRIWHHQRRRNQKNPQVRWVGAHFAGFGKRLMV